MESHTRRLGETVKRTSGPLEGIESICRQIASTSLVAVTTGTASGTDGSQLSTYNLLCAVSALIGAIHCALSGEREDACQYLGAASQSLAADAASAEASSINENQILPKKRRGGLAPWQVRHVSTHIEEHLSENVSCEDLSAVAQLSLSHFARAFRDSFGCPPHTYLTKRRLERAQGLMLATNRPLGQIALECGFTDQAHLSRLFQRFVSESPAAWRRARISIAGTHQQQPAI